MSAKVYLSLGSNIGNREENLSAAIDRLKDLTDGSALRVSSFYETEPWGRVDQASFINCAVEIVTSIEPENLLRELKRIEVEVGRIDRPVRWGERELDIDIMLYGNQIIDTDLLIIPHKYLTQRRFMLVTLAELNMEIVIPGLSMTVEQALSECTDHCWVKQLNDTF